MPVIGNEPAREERASHGLKYYSLHFRYRGNGRSLRLIGWSEASVMREFRERFPEAQPERIEYLGDI